MRTRLCAIQVFAMQCFCGRDLPNTMQCTVSTSEAIGH